MKNALFVLPLLVTAPAFALSDPTDSFAYLNESFAVAKQNANAEAPIARSASQSRFTEAGDPLVVPPSTKTRAQVVAEIKEAARRGELRYGEEGAAPVLVQSGPGLSRAQVAAETQEAARLGLLKFGEAGPREPTAAENAQIRAAGLRAVEQLASTK